MFGDIGFGELLIIFLVALLFFGAKRLPDLAGGLGKSIREFKKGLKDVQDEVSKEIHQPSNNTSKGDEKTVHS
ncbi:MAG: twin-arginine translocase TatA/TatE family subunit [Candidatus Latescibacteria bacterium]|nr:twin-arginine translocase TatA/TatE family subunit [Candidatus Latescibacterota bacterium]